jgi:hypothetical protein
VAARATTIASHCTVSVTGTEFTVVLSVAVIMILEYVPGLVAGLSVSVACPNTVDRLLKSR